MSAGPLLVLMLVAVLPARVAVESRETLRAVALRAGCETPVVEMRSVSSDRIQLMIRCAASVPPEPVIDTP